MGIVKIKSIMSKVFNIFIFLIVVASFLFVKCNSEYNVDCVQCITKYDSIAHKKVRPDIVALTVYVTINSENPTVPVILYKGKVDVNNLNNTPIIRRKTLTTSKDTILVTAENNDYTVEATYLVKGKNIFAWDGASLNIREIKQACDSICWAINGNELNVQLGYSTLGK